MNEENKELNQMLDAIRNILAGKPIEDLDTCIENLRQTHPFPTSCTTPKDIKAMMYTAQYENRLLQGENPNDVYLGIYGYESSDCKEVQKANLEFLKKMVSKKEE